MIDLETYAQIVDIPVSDIKSKKRFYEISAARQAYWYYLYQNGYGFSEMSRMFGFSHCNILQGVKRISNLIAMNDRYIQRFLKAIS